MVTNYKQVGNLKVAPVLYQFINEEALPGSGLSTENFWSDFEALVTELTPVNKRLLEKRDQLQAQINAWHQENPDGDFNENWLFRRQDRRFPYWYRRSRQRNCLSGRTAACCTCK